MSINQPICESAPAKINLALHVTGQRADGYHLLDSLVTFADFGDQVILKPSRDLTLRITGPEAEGLLADDDNLVLKAAHALLKTAPGPVAGADIELRKYLPIASGIGGGSADAAAALRGLARLWDLPAEVLKELPQIALQLGADVPMCVFGKPAHVSGIGEQIAPAALPELNMVLINNRARVSTPAVFEALENRRNGAMDPLEGQNGEIDWTQYLCRQRNDLESAAISLEPGISDCLTALRQQADCTLARMSGSGATCFGVFSSREAADAAHRSLSQHHQDWWIVRTQTPAGR